MGSLHCPTCQCKPGPPDYPVVCDRCGLSYGPDELVKSHRPGGENCNERIRAKKEKPNV